VQYHILILDTELDMGGKEKLLYQYLERADRDRFRFTVCCLKRGGYYKERIQALGIPFHDNLLRHRYDALAFRSLAKILRSERVHLVETFTHPHTVLFSYLARQQGLVDRVLISHHAIGSAFKKRVLSGYVLPLLRRADAHLAVADAQRRYLVDSEGVPEERVHLIYNGVDADQYRPALPGEREAIRRQLGVPDDALVLMAVGSLKPLKGFDALIRASAQLLRTRRDARLVFIGSGLQRVQLEALAAGLGIANQVVFAGLRDDVHAVLRAADVLVLSSRTEVLPTVVLEAMATGLPVVATRVGGVPEIVEPERSAILVPPDDEAALAAALERVTAAPDLRRALGSRGRAIVELRFRLERMCAERESLFSAILDSPSRRQVANGGPLS
jgi:glycosyltransferase involved in cell wall biosynthesis